MGNWLAGTCIICFLWLLGRSVCTVAFLFYMFQLLSRIVDVSLHNVVSF